MKRLTGDYWLPAATCRASIISGMSAVCHKKDLQEVLDLTVLGLLVWAKTGKYPARAVALSALRKIAENSDTQTRNCLLGGWRGIELVFERDGIPSPNSSHSWS
jgi:hypothetical protein